MRKITIIILFITALLSKQSLFGQANNLTTFPFDTVAIHMLRGDLGLLLTASYTERSESVNISMLTTGKAEYIFPHGTDINLSIYQWFQHDNNKNWKAKSYLVAGTSLWKYKIDTKGDMAIRPFYIQPFVLFQNNSDRGLNVRSEIGLLVHPISTKSKKITFDLGIGVTQTFENWKIIDEEDIADLPSDEQNKIRDIANQLPANNNGNYHFSSIKAVVAGSSIAQLSNNIQLDLTASIHQGFKSPYNKELQEKYSDLKGISPSILLEAKINVGITKSFSANAYIRFDWERGGMNIYDSRHESFFMVGVNWRFTKFAKLKDVSL